MSEIACVYNDGLWCKKFSTEEKTSHCCMRFDGPCPHQTPSNADRIRAMTDEELAEYMEEHCIESLCDIVCGGRCRAIRTFEKTSDEVCKDIIRDWLQQPAGGADHA